MRENTGFVVSILIAGAIMLFNIAWFATGIYIVLHFVKKYW